MVGRLETRFETEISGRRIMVTGHTGFTGTWAIHWLHALGAEIHGLALEPPTNPNLFEATNAVSMLASHHVIDIGDLSGVANVVRDVAPDVILHLAAQPLVRWSYAEPVETFTTNVMGTVNILEASRRALAVRGVVCITTDKVYHNREWLYGYRETDRLGGADPYSASKACAELAISSYRSSLASWGQDLLIPVARGGNIIGGGDWAADRLIPDFARACAQNIPVTIRNPDATRPWQHVLCLVHGYLMLVAKVLAGDRSCSDAWNFGPSSTEALAVSEVVEALRKDWRQLEVRLEKSTLHESRHLALDRSKAETILGWHPGWNSLESIRKTATWYSEYLRNPSSASLMTAQQLSEYREAIFNE